MVVKFSVNTYVDYDVVFPVRNIRDMEDSGILILYEFKAIVQSVFGTFVAVVEVLGKDGS